jgi:hypothetical protein
MALLQDVVVLQPWIETFMAAVIERFSWPACTQARRPRQYSEPSPPPQRGHRSAHLAMIYTRPVRNEAAKPARHPKRKHVDISSLSCFIAVDDHDKPLAFSRDVLAWACTTMSGSRDALGNRRRAVAAQYIVLEPPLAGPNASPPTRGHCRNCWRRVLHGVTPSTGDYDATFDRIRAAGGEVLDSSRLLDRQHPISGWSSTFAQATGARVALPTELAQIR